MFTNDDCDSVVMPIGHNDLHYKIFSLVYGVPQAVLLNYFSIHILFSLKMPKIKCSNTAQLHKFI
jgi:hypothetical protein